MAACWHRRAEWDIPSPIPIARTEGSLKSPSRSGGIAAFAVTVRERHNRRERIMFKEFKNFLFRGNLLDLAAAVILGGAFGAVVTSLVKDIITPVIAAVGHQPDLSGLKISIGDGRVAYGTFLNTVISFVIVAGVMFLVLKAASRATKLRATTDEPDADAPPPSDEAVLLAEIRDLLQSNAAR